MLLRPTCAATGSWSRARSATTAIPCPGTVVRPPARSRKVSVVTEPWIPPSSAIRRTASACDDQCQTIPIVCGNGIVEQGEECDDSNTLPGDGCSPTCTIEEGECGDGTVDPPEQCDPPDGVSVRRPMPDHPDRVRQRDRAAGRGVRRQQHRCPGTVVRPPARSRKVCVVTEPWMPPSSAIRRTASGATTNARPSRSCAATGSCSRARSASRRTRDTCDDQCQTIAIECGDGIVQPGEECEPPNTDTCDANCQTVEFVEFCGDEILQSGEQCDDGNTMSGDGCSPDCRIEGTACSDFPCGRKGRKAEICHVPPGNEREMRTLCIAPSAVPAHLRNHPGDHCGPCEDDHHDHKDTRTRTSTSTRGRGRRRPHGPRPQPTSDHVVERRRSVNLVGSM